MAPIVAADPGIGALLKIFDARPGFRWTEGALIRLGYDPSTVRRGFRRHFGMTFLEMARQRRLRDGFATLASGGKVIEAQIDAGFSSASAFRTAFAKLLGHAPGRFPRNALLLADWIETPLGPMIAVSDTQSLHLLEFIDRKALPAALRRLQARVHGALGIGRYSPIDQVAVELRRFFAGESARFTTPLALHGSAFARTVWRALQEIPAGETRSYSEIAQSIGHPAATRAVARANGINQIALVIPCHRVIGADGALVGYGGGLWRKQRLIELERAYRISDGKELK